MAKFEASELTLNKEGKVYHLNLGPEDVADTVILVGDPDRVAFVGSFFDSIRFKTQNREFCTITGTYQGKELSVVSTGIGTDNVDIVLNEIDAAVNINLHTREVNKELRSIEFVRIGTCGALRANIEPGSYILSRYAIGLDGVANFYEIKYTEDEEKALEEFISKSGWGGNLNTPYVKSCDVALANRIGQNFIDGITTTANGFYGPQGRAIRIPLSLPDFKENIRKFEWQGYPVSNLEMETSALYALADTLGHKAVTVCLVLANRYSNKFMAEYKENMANLIRTILDRLTK